MSALSIVAPAGKGLQDSVLLAVWNFTTALSLKTSIIQPSEEHDPDRPSPIEGHHQTSLEQKPEPIWQYADGL